jgi:uncharacterized protein (TIGR00255 family)
MIKSMTGFARRELGIAPFGKVSVELRSTNHKFLEIALHMPEGFLSLEENIKKIIEGKIKRGRVNCVVSFAETPTSKIFMNRPLIKNYLEQLSGIKKQFNIQGEVQLDTLIHLPGVLSLAQNPDGREGIWPRLRTLASSVVDDLAKTRQKEGAALYFYLKNRAQALQADLYKVKMRFKKAIADKLKRIKTDEERAGFLKEADITEEVERLSFHIKNLINKLAKDGPIGKELDFIAQEMQREANTMAAKSCAAVISAKAVQIKSEIEKIREQLQNVE